MIVFVEDQEEAADLYLYEMRKNQADVRYFKSVADAWTSLQDSNEPYVLVLDIMMPASPLFSALSTSDGLTTGLRFYRLFRGLFPNSFVIALTNLSDPVVESTLRGDPRAVVRRKDRYYYDELAEEVQELAAQFLRDKKEAREDHRED
jgi:CheY-like chemotaxis protein